MKTYAAVLSLFALAFNSALAHPAGHDGTAGETAAHLLSQPDHLLLLVGLPLLAVAVALVVWRKRKAK